MTDLTEYFTYRLANLPRTIKNEHIRSLFNEDDRRLIISTSIGPCPHHPAAFNVATVTFNGEQNLKKLASYYEQEFPGIRLDDNFHGLTPLNTVDGTSKADFIAITGLAGRAFASWQNQAGQMWLRDFLPSQFSDCRFFTYGYPSKVRQSLSHASIASFREQFVREIINVRSKAEESRIPLILIGHSLGCIIIKEAIVESSSLSSTPPRLHEFVCGIIFFGAPHRGLNNPELYEAVQGTPPDDLVRDLRPNSSLLSALNQSFPEACKDIKIISCYETQHTCTYQPKNPTDPGSEWAKTGPPRFMVPPSSACLDWPKAKESKIAIHADHSNIAKLNDSIGSSYYQIREEIELLLAAAPTLMKRRREVDLAPQHLLGLLFMLQYEYYWFMAWSSYKAGVPPSHQPLPEILGNGTDMLDLARLPYGHPAYHIVNSIGMIIENLSALLRKYHLRPVSEDASTQTQRSAFTNAAASPDAQSSMPLIQFSFPLRQDPGLGGEGNLDAYVFNIEIWTNSDREQLNYLLSKFRSENNRLSQLTGHSSSFDLLASSRVLNRSAHSSNNLGHIEGIAQVEHKHTSLSQRASLKRKLLEDEPEEKAPMMYPISWLKKKAGTGSSNYRVVTSLEDKSMAVSQVRNQRLKWVLVEWRSYEMAKDLESQRQAKEQALQLAYDLGIQNKPPLLKTLHCAGLVEDTNERRFGFLFDLPEWVDVAKEPRTLHSYLADKTMASTSGVLPTLRERFTLARDLAYSLAELHGANILHKNLHSGNVLFFPARFTDTISISNPFIGGFQVSRPDQKGQLSLDIAGGRFDLYRHPELRDPSNELQGRPSSDRKHDIYSLGLVLLEIGIWSCLDSLQQEEKSPAENAKRFLKYANRYLPHNMGTGYCEAVIECLDPEHLSSVQSVGSPSNTQMGGASLELFIQNVIRRLEVSTVNE